MGHYFPYYFLGDEAEVQSEQSDVIWAYCCNQLDVLGRHRICYIIAPALIKETTSYSTKYNLNVLFLSSTEQYYT